MALLPVHSQDYSQIRKKSFKHACNKVAVSQRPVSYRGQPLTPTMLRRMGNCPPPARTKVASAPRARAGRATQALRVLSWNAGHLSQQQRSFRLRPPRHVTSWFCRILIGRPLRNSLPQAGPAFRPHPQTTRSGQKEQKGTRGHGPKPTKTRRQGLRATARTSIS